MRPRLAQKPQKGYTFASHLTGSSQHHLAQWLTSVIDHLSLLCSGKCISNFFTFTNIVITADFHSFFYLRSFDICNLFTNVSLAEIIDIFATALYDGELKAPSFLRAVFIELMQISVSTVEFSFNNVMMMQNLMV